MYKLPPHLFELAARITDVYGAGQVYALYGGRVWLACLHATEQPPGRQVHPSRPRREADLQCWLDAQAGPQAPLVLAHAADTVYRLAGEGQPFFARALQNGKLIYGEPLTVYPSPFTVHPIPIPDFERALGFYRLALNCRNEDSSLCLFLLHQCTEQACMQYILSRTGYRMDSHNLLRLLRFCEAIGQPKPYTLNPPALLPLLNRAYLAGRYDAGFHPTCEHTQQLITAVSALLHRLMQTAHPLTPLPDEEDLRPPIAARL